MSSYTDDLLSELKETVAADVAAEEARLRAEMQARAAAEEDAARQAEAARRAEVEARLEAERHRRRLALETRREVAGPASEPAVPQRSQPVERLAAPAPAPAPKGHGAGFYFVVMGLPMLCITAIVVAWILNAPQPDLNPQMGQVPAPESPVIEVHGGPATDAPAIPVKVDLPAEDAVEDEVEEADEAPVAEADEKKETAAERKAREKREKRARARAAERARAAAAKKAEEEEANSERRLELGNMKEIMGAE